MFRRRIDMSRPDDFAELAGRSPLLLADVLLQACLSPWGLDDYGALFRYKYLVFDGASVAALSPLDQLRISARLVRLPCPVIALVPKRLSALIVEVDVMLEQPRELGTIAGHIEANPIAAMTLVQLLRNNEAVSAVQGLYAESMAYAALQSGPEFARARQGLSRPVVARESDEAVVNVTHAGSELHIQLNRPEARNAYNAAMRDAFFEALQVLAMDKGIVRAIVAGQGSCYSIGGDLAEFGTVSDGATAHALRSARSVSELLLAQADRLEFRLHGACIGAGIELPAFACRVVARTGTFFQLPELRFGLLPGAGGTVSVLGRIGRHRTAWMALSGRRVNADTALEWGLIDAIV